MPATIGAPRSDPRMTRSSMHNRPVPIRFLGPRNDRKTDHAKDTSTQKIAPSALTVSVNLHALLTPRPPWKVDVSHLMRLVAVEPATSLPGTQSASIHSDTNPPPTAPTTARASDPPEPSQARSAILQPHLQTSPSHHNPPQNSSSPRPITSTTPNGTPGGALHHPDPSVGNSLISDDPTP